MENFIICITTNIVMLLSWWIIKKIRNSNQEDMKVLDNGYEFYSSLKDKDKISYWKADSKIVDHFFITLFVFVELTLLCYILASDKWYWMGMLALSMIVSSTVYIVKSIKLQKKY